MATGKRKTTIHAVDFLMLGPWEIIPEVGGHEDADRERAPHLKRYTEESSQ